MKTLKYIIVLLIFATLIFAVIKSRENNVPEFEIDLSPEINAEQLCYIWNTEAGDRAMLSLDIREKNTIGEFYYFPAQKDAKTGIFRGTVSLLDKSKNIRLVDAIWETKAEGVTAKEELRILIEGSIARPGFGEMTDRGDGIYRYADPSVISYPFNLQETDCGDEAMD